MNEHYPFKNKLLNKFTEAIDIFIFLVILLFVFLIINSIVNPNTTTKDSIINKKVDISKLLNLSIDQIKEKFPKIEESNNGTTKALIYEKDNIKINFESYKDNKIEYIQITDSKLICRDNSTFKDNYKTILSEYGFDQNKISSLSTQTRNNGIIDVSGYEGNTLTNLNCSVIENPKVIRVTYFNNPN